MIFGVWPGVVQGDLVDLSPMECPPEDPQRTEEALRKLQGDAESFYIRCYRHFGPGVTPRSGARATPDRPRPVCGTWTADRPCGVLPERHPRPLNTGTSRRGRYRIRPRSTRQLGCLRERCQGLRQEL